MIPGYGTLLGALIGILSYFFLAFCLRALAKRTDTANEWLAFIPVANFYLTLKIAKRPGWWTISLFIPILNLIILVVSFMDIAKAVNKPDWLGILMIVPVVNFIVLAHLAFSE